MSRQQGDAGGAEDVLSADAYQTIFNNAGDGLFVHPPDSDEVLAVNNRLTEMLGYTEAELLDMTVSEFTADDWDSPVTPTDRIKQAREDGHVTFEWRNQRKDGSIFWVEVTLTLVMLDGEERVVASVRNIEERKEQERRARAIFDQTYQFTGLMEPDGTLIEANQTALNFGGLRREDVIGERVWDCYWFAYDSAVQGAAKTAVERAADGEFVRQNLEVRGSDGTEIIDFSIRPVTNEQGAVNLLIPEGRPITEQVAQQERLEAYHRVMRHNVRNKLTTITGFADEIERVAESDQIQGYAESIREAGAELDQISEQVRELDQLRKADVSPEEIHLETFLSTVVGQYRATERTTLTVSTEAELTVAANPGLLRLAVENLVENAVEHGGGSVEVSATRLPSESRTAVEVVVRDTGSGINPSEYEPVVEGSSGQLEHPSSIGLLITKWCVDDLEGELLFESDPETGTSARIRLPAATDT
jgi:PAS domain S-box-containing protein